MHNINDQFTLFVSFHIVSNLVLIWMVINTDVTSDQYV